MEIVRKSIAPGLWSITIPERWRVRDTRVRVPILGRAVCVDLRPDQCASLAATADILMLINEHEEYVVSLDGDADAARVTGSELLRLMGDAPPAPTTTEPPEHFRQTVADVRIEGQYPPLSHQFAAAWFRVQHRRAFDLSTMRTGKTGSTMLALAYLFRTQQCGKALILAPLSCVRPVWTDALAATLPGIRAVAMIGSRSQKLRALSAGAEIIVSNYETIGMFSAELSAWRPHVVVIDECTHYASLTSQRTRAIRALLTETAPAWVWGLTGTPGHDPLKAFAMSKTINPAAVNVKSLTAWRDLTQFRWGPQAWQWKNKACAPALIKQALSPAILFRKEDLFDLPPVVWTAREAELSSAQRRAMAQLRSSMVALLGDGSTITVQQQSVLISKLLQIAAGCVRLSDEDAAAPLDCDGRWDALCELLDESQSGKRVVFCSFRAPLHRLADELRRRGYAVGIVDGDVPERQRTDLFRRFQHVAAGVPEADGGCDVLIAHPRTTAFGVELGAADLMIWDGPALSGDFVFSQAIERLSSLKQTGSQVTIATLYACPEERKLFDALRAGRSASQAVADLFKEVTS